MKSIYSAIGPDNSTAGNIIGDADNCTIGQVHSSVRALVQLLDFITTFGDLIGDKIRDNPRTFAL